MAYLHAYQTVLATIADEDVRLWDILREFNAFVPNETNEHNYMRAQQFVVRGLKDGVLALYYAQWGIDEKVEIQRDKAISLVGKSASWIPPELESPFINVRCTLRGEDYIKQGRFDHNVVNAVMKVALE